jgi:hypothetical protein
MLGAQASCLPERRRREAALPLDVRNGSAFPPAAIGISERLRLEQRRSLKEWSVVRKGRAFPHIRWRSHAGTI